MSIVKPQPPQDDELLEMIRESASKFLASSGGRQPEGESMWTAFAELGWLSLPVDIESGGLGGGLREVAALFDAFGQSLVSHPYLDAVLALHALRQAPQLGGVRDGVSRVALATCEAGLRNPLAAQSTVLQRLPGSGLRLNGEKRNVRFASSATHLLVSAVDPSLGGSVLCWIDATAPGIAMQPMPRIDGAPAAVVSFRDVVVEAVIGGVEELRSRAVLLGMAETTGAARRTLAITLEYLNSREQFGKRLSSLPALRIRVADLQVELELASAYLNRAIGVIQMETSPDAVSLICLGAAALVASTARRVAREAIQLHGAIGFTQEALPGRYLKRIEALIGEGIPVEAALEEYSRRTLAGESAPGIESSFSDEDRAFAAEVRALTDRALDGATRRKVQLGLPLNKQDYVGWQQALYRQDWITAAWPESQGGADWSPMRQYLFQSESGRSCAPDVMPYGVRMIGPVLGKFGTTAQQEQHWPGVRSSEVWWCQGYSEPNAGSDLASLRTRAELVGDHYVVNGTKIWTTQAHYADWMHCLVRTGDPRDRHRTISYLMIDMRTPGITVHPIESIDGHRHLNQVFFDDVKVPLSQRIGEEGEGWKMAGFLLAHERASLAKVAMKERILGRVRKRLLERRESLKATGEWSALGRRLAQLSIRLRALESLELSYLGRATPGAADGSILKVAGSELQQQITELGLEILGNEAVEFDRGLLEIDQVDSDPAASANTAMVYEYLYNRAATLLGGTSEIQRTIIARALLPE